MGCNDLEISYPEDEIMVQWVRALRGLTSVEAERALAQSMTVHDGTFDHESLNYLQSLKRNLIQQTGIMDFHEPSTSFSDIGGLDLLIDDLKCDEQNSNMKHRRLGLTRQRVVFCRVARSRQIIDYQSVAGNGNSNLEFNMANVPMAW